jgi:DNA-binding winged helix-turn-helix (wHTH) protein/Tol biopolymer transport system component
VELRASHKPPTFRFGVFEADLRAGELRRNGSKLKLQNQPFQILAALLERPGEVVTRDELRARLWSADTFVDIDNGLNSAIRRLRDTLGDSAENPRFVETVGHRGYRFIARVDGSPAGDAIGIAAIPEPARPYFARPWIAIACLTVAVSVLFVWALWRGRAHRADITELPLTANSMENSVSSMALSHDGKQLAYADSTGVFLKQIRTGEVNRVPLPPDFTVSVDDWFSDGSHLLVSRAEAPGKASLWCISVFGGPPRELAEDASGGALSPDGSHIAFYRGDVPYFGLWGREEWVMRADGTEQVKVAAARPDDSQVGAPTWSPDGKRIAYIRTKWAYNARTSIVEVNDWQDASAATLFSDNRLSPALHWLPDGRLVYAFGSTQHQQDSSLWVVPVKESTKISSTPRRIAEGHGWISKIAGSADGKVVIFLRGNWLPSVYIATLGKDGMELLATRRLTLDENENIPFAWTPDSKAILFSSDRNGTREIFKQAINEPLAERLVTGADHLSQPRVTPDGSEIVYISTPKSASPESPSAIFSVPIGGGTPRLVLKDVGIAIIECARMSSTVCMYTTVKAGTWETFRFDVRSGKSPSAPQIDPNCNWSLSPDGSERAIVEYRPNQGTIQFRSTSTGATRDVAVKGWNGLMGADWSADGRSLLVSWHNFDRDSALLNVTLDGRASVLMRSTNPEIWAAIPSPDGRWLAIAAAGGAKNVWQVENF